LTGSSDEKTRREAGFLLGLAFFAAQMQKPVLVRGAAYPSAVHCGHAESLQQPIVFQAIN
jgi:hypothetical protein